MEQSQKTEGCWVYQGKCLEAPPEGYYGFVYLITNILDGRIYVGKKAFSYRKKTKLSKKAKKATGKRVKVEQVDSQWLGYYGSSLDVKADVKTFGEENFTREILYLCKNKAQMNYMEAKEQFARDVLLTNSYNKWIGVKCFKSSLLI